uniref:Calpain catalytic domain-containing protein n=1 Tax=Oreochromis niloticus TaxID=8128 RepID=I3JDK3_ORENI
MAKSETCLINLRYQDGSEGSPSNPAKFRNQDFAQIKADCLRKGELFVDNAFPPNSNSLGDVPGLSEVKWLRPPAYCTDGMSRFDFAQGSLGNCWFLSAMSALTFQKNLMEQVVPMDQSFEDYAGIFHFRFWRFGKWVDVVIDDYLPTINKQFLSVSSKCQNEFWAPLLEKAYAKVCGSYADMHGGSSSDAFKDFTGGLYHCHDFKKPNAPSHDELWLTLSRATECKSLICSMTGEEADKLANTGLADGHGYSVTGITEVNSRAVRLVRVMNPWGAGEWNGKWSDKSDMWDKVEPEVRKMCFDRDDGEFWMEFEDFCSHFREVTICSETPNFLDGDFKCQWKCMIYDGSWVAGISAGGKWDEPTFATNPQYRIQVSVIDKEEPEDKNVLVSLMQKPLQEHRRQMKIEEVVVLIYKVPPGVSTNNDKYMKLFLKRPTRYQGFIEVIQLHSLEPGEYVIVPFTYEPNITADFVLTVYTKADAKISQIAKLLKRDLRTIKRFIQNSQQGRKKRVEKPRRKITAHELRKVKRAAAKMPFATSLAIFQSCNITGVPKSTRCAILRDMAKVRKAERRPPLNKTHKLKRQDWAKKYLKTDFSKVLWTDEMRVSLDGPDGWARGWTVKGQRAPVRLRRQQGGGGVLVWAGIIKDELVGPFRVEDGVKLNSQSYCQFLEDTFFKQWYRKKSASFKKNMIFMQDNAPSHASKYSTVWLARKGIKEEKLMTWPPCSPDLNPIENLWSIIKCEIYKEGKQYTSLNSVWEAVVAAARNVDGEQIKTLTESMDGRLLSVLAKKGGYIGR